MKYIHKNKRDFDVSVLIASLYFFFPWFPTRMKEKQSPDYLETLYRRIISPPQFGQLLPSNIPISVKLPILGNNLPQSVHFTCVKDIKKHFPHFLYKKTNI